MDKYSSDVLAISSGSPTFMIALNEESSAPTEDDLFHALERLKYQIKNSCKPLDKIGSQKVGFAVDKK